MNVPERVLVPCPGSNVGDEEVVAGVVGIRWELPHKSLVLVDVVLATMCETVWISLSSVALLDGRVVWVVSLCLVLLSARARVSGAEVTLPASAELDTDTDMSSLSL